LKHKLSKRQNKELSSQISLQMIKYFHRKGPNGVLYQTSSRWYALRWQPSWISDPYKNINFLNDHPIIIYLIICNEIWLESSLFCLLLSLCFIRIHQRWLSLQDIVNIGSFWKMFKKKSSSQKLQNLLNYLIKLVHLIQWKFILQI
jgi:hypothetical protein